MGCPSWLQLSKFARSSNEAIHFAGVREADEVVWDRRWLNRSLPGKRKYILLYQLVLYHIDLYYIAGQAKTCVLYYIILHITRQERIHYCIVSDHVI